MERGVLMVFKTAARRRNLGNLSMRKRAPFLPLKARAALALPVLGLGLVHCTWSDLDSLGAGSADAGTPANDASTAPPVTHDAGMDSTTNPPVVDSGGPPVVDSGAPPVVDSGVDASDAGVDAALGPPAAALPVWLDAGTAGWCDLHPGYDFCADFDETPLPAGFSASDGAFLAQTSSNPSSGPNDLLLYVPPQQGTGSWGSKLSRQFGAVSSVVFAFDFYPEVLNATSSGLLFAGLDFLGNSNAKYSIRLAYNEGAPRLEESYLGSPSDVYHSNFTVPVGAWSRIQVEISFPLLNADGGIAADAGAGATESIYVNGVLQGTPEMLAPPVGFDQSPNMLLGGVFGTSPCTEWALRYDNVTLDIQ
jgi:hypothetical protein